MTAPAAEAVATNTDAQRKRLFGVRASWPFAAATSCPQCPLASTSSFGVASPIASATWTSSRRSLSVSGPRCER